MCWQGLLRVQAGTGCFEAHVCNDYWVHMLFTASVFHNDVYRQVQATDLTYPREASLTCMAYSMRMYAPCPSWVHASHALPAVPSYACDTPQVRNHGTPQHAPVSG